MTATLFSEHELNKLNKQSHSLQEKKIKRRFEELALDPSYQDLSTDEKLDWLNNEVNRINSNTKVNGPLMIFGFFVGSLFGSIAGGIVGFALFLVILGLCCAAGTTKAKEEVLRPYLQLEINKENKQKEETLAKEKEEAKAERARKICKLEAKSEELFSAMKKQPSLIPTKFSEYRENVALEIQHISPGQEHINLNTAAKEFTNQVLIGSLGIWTDGYIPAKDEKCFQLIELLSREKKRIKELATVARLPFIAIEYYQEISRNYYGLHREGGNASIYDEHLITNEVMAMKESLVVKGDYHDKSLHLDKSVTHSTQVHNAVIDNGEYDEQRIKKEVLKIIISDSEEASSRAELMANIPVKESRLLAVLEELQLSGILQIGNRPSGEVVYKLDRLA